MAVYRPSYRDAKTGQLKQSKIWWINFTIGGRRIQESSGSSRKTVAVEYEKQRRRDLERALAGIPSEVPKDRIASVQERVATYLAKYPSTHRARSVRFARQRLAHVQRLLGGCVLFDLTEQRVQEYIRTRLAEGAGGRTINAELGELSRAMNLKWSVAWPNVRKLEENHDAGRALEAAEEQAILDSAMRNPSRLIYPFLFTLAWTGMRSDEARTLRWSQINFAGAGEITIGKAKTDAGTGRRIPMTANLKAVLSQHAAWYASKAGELKPEFYVFSSMNRLALKDPQQPVTSLKTAWESVREAAGVQCRLHDLRHSFCTKLAEAGVPESTMLDIMGHVSAAMLRRYSHIRAQARREAMDALESRQFSNVAAKVSAKVGDFEGAKKVVTH